MTETAMVQVKRCYRCGLSKPISEFGKHSREKDGLQGECLDCKRARDREYARAHRGEHKEYLAAWHLAHQEQQKGRMREYYLAHRDAQLSKEREDREANPEKHRARDRARNVGKRREDSIIRARDYRKNHPVEYKAMLHAWYLKNRDHAIELTERRTGRIRDSRTGIVRRRDIYERDQGRCGICGGPVVFEEMHLDHVIPLARGGVHGPENVQVAHALCNRKKHAKVVPRWV
jgi:5-methylcytosine-specific restriction endonuclease McrA